MSKPLHHNLPMLKTTLHVPPQSTPLCPVGCGMAAQRILHFHIQSNHCLIRICLECLDLGLSIMLHVETDGSDLSPQHYTYNIRLMSASAWT